MTRAPDAPIRLPRRAAARRKKMGLGVGFVVGALGLLSVVFYAGAGCNNLADQPSQPANDASVDADAAADTTPPPVFDSGAQDAGVDTTSVEAGEAATDATAIDAADAAVMPPCGNPGDPCCAGGVCTGANASCTDGGLCKACGATGEECCSGNLCLSGGCCVSDSVSHTCAASGSTCAFTDGGVCANGSCGSCGYQGGPCCSSGCTAPWTLCDMPMGLCGACGGPGGPCCAGGACNGATLACVSGACANCGGVGEPCCVAGSACTGTLSCGAGVCR